MEFPHDYRRFLKADDWATFSEKDHPTDQKKGLPRAPVQKPYPAEARLVDLVSPDRLTVGTMSMREAIARRKSRRAFSADPLSLEELSYLLWATQGVRVRRDVPNGTATMRTSPSGGSLHTFETYLFAWKVADLECGLYRYLPLEHKLLPLERAVSPAEVGEACRGQRFVGECAVTFAWTTIPYRMEWRYSLVSHKIIAQDSGHLCQNLYLAAESIDCGTCAIGAYDQKKMDALLGVDGEDEFTIYVAPVGKAVD